MFRYILFGAALLCALMLLKESPEPQAAMVKAAIIDDCGEEVWVQSKSVELIDDEFELRLGEDIPLYKEYLDEVSAEKLSLWLDKGEGFEHYRDIALSEVTMTTFDQPEDLPQTGPLEMVRREVVLDDKASKGAPAVEHLAFRAMQKGGEIDPQKVLEARSIVQERVAAEAPKRKSRDAGLRSWSNLGPNNIGGRIRAIAIKPKANPSDPYEIFIGAAGGGLWRSTNGGLTWNPINDFLPSLAITCIVIDPTNSNIMYASTGEGQAPVMGLPGAGVFKSTNGGINWTQLADMANQNFVHKLAIVPDKPNTVFAVTRSAQGVGEVWKTTNYGADWDSIYIDFNNGGYTDIEIDADNPSIIYISGISTLIKSTNGGASFTEMLSDVDPDRIPDATSKRIELALGYGPDRLYALVHRDSTSSSNADRCRLYRSLDEGLTWTEQFSDVNQVFSRNGFGNYSNEIWADPEKPDHVYFGGVDLWKSTSGGTNPTRISDWTEYHQGSTPGTFSLHADQHILVAAPDYSSSNKRVFIGNDGGIQSTANISTATQYSGWQNHCNISLGITQLYSGAVAKDGSPFGGGAQDNSFMTGTTPTNWSQPKTGDGGYMAISPMNENLMYANTNNQQLWTSINGGANWSSSSDFSLFDNMMLISPFMMNPDDDLELFMGGGRQLWSWTPTVITPLKLAIPQSPQISALDACNDGQTLWVGYTNGVIEYSVNGGTSWSGDLYTFPLMGQSTFITDIAAKPGCLVQREAIVTFAGYRVQNIFKHRYFFQTQSSVWTDISLGIPLQVNTVTYNPINTNWIYVGTDLGIFASEDEGATWSLTPLHGQSGTEYGNDGPVYTEVTDLFWSGDGSAGNPMRLWATTFGRGIWRSNFVLDNIYVDKSMPNDFGPGTFDSPYKTFRSAVDAAGNGATIVFKSTSSHNEVPSPIVITKRVVIEVSNGPAHVN